MTSPSQALASQNVNVSGVYSFPTPAAAAGPLGLRTLTATVTTGTTPPTTVSDPFELVADLTACTTEPVHGEGGGATGISRVASPAPF